MLAMIQYLETFAGNFVTLSMHPNITTITAYLSQCSAP